MRCINFSLQRTHHYTKVYIQPFNVRDVKLHVAFNVDAGYIASREILLYCFISSLLSASLKTCMLGREARTSGSSI